MYGRTAANEQQGEVKYHLRHYTHPQVFSVYEHKYDERDVCNSKKNDLKINK